MRRQFSKKTKKLKIKMSYKKSTNKKPEIGASSSSSLSSCSVVRSLNQKKIKDNDEPKLTENMSSNDLCLYVQFAVYLCNSNQLDQFGIWFANISNSNPSLLGDLMKNEKFCLCVVQLRFFQKEYDQVLELLKSCPFSAKEDYVKLWEQTQYKKKEEILKQPLTPLQRFRVRKRFPPPQNICPFGRQIINPIFKRASVTLKSWFEKHLENPYPSSSEKQSLAKETGLTLYQVKTWFANTRRRRKVHKLQSTLQGHKFLNKAHFFFDSERLVKESNEALDLSIQNLANSSEPNETAETNEDTKSHLKNGDTNISAKKLGSLISTRENSEIVYKKALNCSLHCPEFDGVPGDQSPVQSLDSRPYSIFKTYPNANPKSEPPNLQVNSSEINGVPENQSPVQSPNSRPYSIFKTYPNPNSKSEPSNLEIQTDVLNSFDKFPKPNLINLPQSQEMSMQLNPVLNTQTNYKAYHLPEQLDSKSVIPLQQPKVTPQELNRATSTLTHFNTPQLHQQFPICGLNIEPLSPRTDSPFLTGSMNPIVVPEAVHPKSAIYHLMTDAKDDSGNLEGNYPGVQSFYNPLLNNQGIENGKTQDYSEVKTSKPETCLTYMNLNEPNRNDYLLSDVLCPTQETLAFDLSYTQSLTTNISLPPQPLGVDGYLQVIPMSNLQMGRNKDWNPSARFLQEQISNCENQLSLEVSSSQNFTESASKDRGLENEIAYALLRLSQKEN